MGQWQQHTFKTTESGDIQADVYPGVGPGPRPAILWLHGGALILGHRGAIRPEQVARYTGAGYTVVSADYRLAPEAKLPSIIADLQDAWRWLQGAGRELLGVDPQRMAVMGHSAGGYLTLMAGCCVEPRPRALVSFYGYGDITGRWYSRPDPHYCSLPAVPREEAEAAIQSHALSGVPSGGSLAAARGQLYLYTRQTGSWPLWVTGHDPDRQPTWFDRYCPARQVTPDYPPTLLLHGDQDTDVPYEQSALMARELARHDVPHELVTLAGRGHGFDGAGDGLRDPVIAGCFDRVLTFLGET